MRFAWWGAEESGLVGSTYYVNSLSAAELDEIALYLNFDMVGSPNFVRFVYDGEARRLGPAGPAGSAAIEDVFNDYFAAHGPGHRADGVRRPVGLPAVHQQPASRPAACSPAPRGSRRRRRRRSTAAPRAQPYDPCYHQACDTFDNNSNVVLDQMSDAIAHATITFAQSTSLVNGVPGKGNFNTPDKINGQAIR